MSVQLHKLKKLLDRVIEHLPSVVILSQKGSSDHDVLSDQYHAIFTVRTNPAPFP